MKRCFAWLLIWLACAAVALWSLTALPLAALFGSGRKGWRLAVAFDQLGNVAAGGDEDETFSARCWRCRERRPYAWLVSRVDWLFLQLSGETAHCRAAHETEMEKRRRALSA